MEKAANQKINNTEQKENSIISKMLRAITFPAAALAGFLVTHVEVRGSADRKAIDDGIFDDIIKEKNALEKPNNTARIKGEISMEEFAKREEAILVQYRRAADERMTHMGRADFASKLKYINRSSAKQAIIDGLTVAGITVGALLAIADSKLLSNMVSRNKEQDR